MPEVLTLFDFPDPSLIIGERATTTVPAQSLYLMNNPFVIRQAEALADKLLASRRRRRRQADAGLPALLLAAAVGEGTAGPRQKFLEDYGKKTDRRAGRVDGAVPGAVRQRGVQRIVN